MKDERLMAPRAEPRYRGTGKGPERTSGARKLWGRRGGEELWRSRLRGWERDGKPTGRELVPSQQGEGLRGGTRQGWGKGQGRDRDGKDQARPRPGSGQEGPNPADARVGVERAKRDRGRGRGQGGKHRAGPRSGREGWSGSGGWMERTQRGPRRDGKARAEPRPRGRKESGERRRPYLSGAGHAEGGRGRGRGSRSPRASPWPARDAQSRRVRGSTDTPVGGGASGHFRRLPYALPLASRRALRRRHVGCGAAAWGPARARGEPWRTQSAAAASLTWAPPPLLPACSFPATLVSPCRPSTLLPAGLGVCVPCPQMCENHVWTTPQPGASPPPCRPHPPQTHPLSCIFLRTSMHCPTYCVCFFFLDVFFVCFVLFSRCPQRQDFQGARMFPDCRRHRVKTNVWVMCPHP